MKKNKGVEVLIFFLNKEFWSVLNWQDFWSVLPYKLLESLLREISVKIIKTKIVPHSLWSENHRIKD